MPTPTTKPFLPIKKFTVAEMVDRPEKGLCYSCDERYHRHHVCKAKILVMITREEIDDSFDQPLDPSIAKPTLPEENESPPTTINFHALEGSSLPSSMNIRLTGSLAKTMV